MSDSRAKATATNAMRVLHSALSAGQPYVVLIGDPANHQTTLLGQADAGDLLAMACTMLTRLCDFAADHGAPNLAAAAAEALSALGGGEGQEEPLH